MITVIDVANFFIYLNKKENNMEYMQLNYLIYFSQGWYTVKNGKKLFDEPIYADHKDGIKINSIFNAYKHQEKLAYFNEFDISIFGSPEIELLIAMYEYYFYLDKKELNEIIFSKNNPIDNAFKNLNNEISIDEMTNFFREREYFDNLK